MAENAGTERVDEPEKEQETVNEEAPMEGNEEDLTDLKIDQQETAKLKSQEPLPVSAESAQATQEALMGWANNLPPEGKQVISLLKSLPVLASVTEDAVIMKKVVELAMNFTHSRGVFEHEWVNNRVLNPIAIQRSNSDDNLLALMVSYVACISSFGNNHRKTLIHECPGTLPFLTACLRSQKFEAIQLAATAMSLLSLDDSNRKKMGELGAISPLVDLLFQGSELDMCLPRTLRAIFNLCKVVENREQAVSEGAVIALMDKIKRRVRVDQVLRTLEMLSRNEKAIAELEDDGMFILKLVFEILREEEGATEEEGVTDEDKEYCMIIIHAACGASVAKTRELINGVMNGRETLDLVVSSGTAKAKEIARELLLKLDSAN